MTRTFLIKAVDACGNTATASTVYTWIANTTAPTLVGVPASTNLGCNPAILPTCASLKALVSATGNCGSATTVTITTNADAISGCLVTRTFSIKAVDACGNTATASTVYTWTANTTAPTLIGVPASTNLGCNPITLPTCASIKRSSAPPATAAAPPLSPSQPTPMP